jgi:transposase
MDASLLDLFWEGFELESHEQLDSQTLCLRLTPKPSQPPFCSSCRHSTLLIDDISWRRVRERDLFSHRVWLDVPVPRVRCPSCGTRREHIPWLAGRQLTQGMVSYVEALVRLLPVNQVAELLDLHWHTVKAIDHQRLVREVKPPDLSRLRRLVMDEFALLKATATRPSPSARTPSRCCGLAKGAAEKRYAPSLHGWEKTSAGKSRR